MLGSGDCRLFCRGACRLCFRWLGHFLGRCPFLLRHQGVAGRKRRWRIRLRRLFSWYLPSPHVFDFVRSCTSLLNLIPRSSARNCSVRFQLSISTSRSEEKVPLGNSISTEAWDWLTTLTRLSRDSCESTSVWTLSSDLWFLGWRMRYCPIRSNFIQLSDFLIQWPLSSTSNIHYAINLSTTIEVPFAPFATSVAAIIKPNPDPPPVITATRSLTYNKPNTTSIRYIE